MPNLLKKEKSFFDTIFIRLVQPNIKQEDKWNKEYLFNNYEKLTSLIKPSSNWIKFFNSGPSKNIDINTSMTEMRIYK